MKIFKISLTVLGLALSFMSCKKDTGIDITPPIVDTNVIKPPVAESIATGIWVGQSVSTSRSFPVYLSTEIKPDGTLNLLNANHQQIGTGTWTLVDSAFNAVYTITATGITYTLNGDLHTDTSPYKLGGRYEYGPNYQDSGYWFMDKQ